MEDLRRATIDTYDRSAQELAEYFRGIGSRVSDIDKAFELVGNPKSAQVVEIGCGDGRDAEEIVKRTPHYLGFDISKGLIDLARQHVPEADFKVADAAEFTFPKNLDIVFAFASLLHLDKDALRQVCFQVQTALKAGGVFYISLKYAPEYREYVKRDAYGIRLFYLYNPDLIRDLAGEGFRAVHLSQELKGNTDWFEIALQKD